MPSLLGALYQKPLRSFVFAFRAGSVDQPPSFVGKLYLWLILHPMYYYYILSRNRKPERLHKSLTRLRSAQPLPRHRWFPLNTNRDDGNNNDQALSGRCNTESNPPSFAFETFHPNIQSSGTLEPCSFHTPAASRYPKHIIEPPSTSVEHIER